MPLPWLLFVCVCFHSLGSGFNLKQTPFCSVFACPHLGTCSTELKKTRRNWRAAAGAAVLCGAEP